MNSGWRPCLIPSCMTIFADRTSSGCASSMHVIMLCAFLFAHVLTIGKPSFSTTCAIQWFGMRTPMMLLPRCTSCASASGFFSRPMRVTGPGRCLSASSGSVMCSRIHWTFGAMMLNGCVCQCLSTRRRITRLLLVALHPMLYMWSVGWMNRLSCRRG